MVDEYINILEEEDDLIQTIPVPGVQPTASGGALDIVLPPTAEGLPDQESSLEWFLRQGGEKDFTAYPKTYFGFGDTSPMYRVASEITDFIGFDVPEFLNKLAAAVSVISPPTSTSPSVSNKLLLVVC